MTNKETFIENLKKNSTMMFSDDLANLGQEEKYMVASRTIMDVISERWKESNKKGSGKRKAYYLSAEYLLGRLMGNNLINLGIKDDFIDALEEFNIDFDEIETCESDAGLGNGGLGRLAACFLDSAATHDLRLNGYGIRYEFGLFRQKFTNGFQDERPDDWLRNGYPWEVKRISETKRVKFGSDEVIAVPYDIPVVGYDSDTINTLRIWGAEPVNSVDLYAFNDSRFDHAQRESNFARSISMVLYPNDNNYEGKILRLKQEYFFVSASIQDLIEKHLQTNGNDISTFAEYHAIHLNDTHPALAIAELMRLLTEEHAVSWKKAWDTCIATFSYTNHTLMAEALEVWSRDVFTRILPDITRIVLKINEHVLNELREESTPESTVSSISIVDDHSIKMANLSILGSHSTNGVAKLHTKLMMEKELNNFYRVYPERFNNKTNGITQRRWLEHCNPELSKLITDILGSKDYLKNLDELEKLKGFTTDTQVLDKFNEIKFMKKRQLCDFLYRKEGVVLNPNTIFDVQVKRLHEYKRQFLNILHVLDLYYRLKDSPNMDFCPRTFIFGAKSAPGYHRAKAVIKFINEVASLINSDTSIKGRIAVHFVENYNVTCAEKIIPAADISQQISTAGTEASGTGNMKFMLNGAVTLGTYDGANIEIFEAAGIDNNFMFGSKVEDLDMIRDTYDPKEFYWEVPGLKRSLDSLIDITFQDKHTEGFTDLYNSILSTNHWSKGDTYFILKDFESYRDAHLDIDLAYRNRHNFARMCLSNISAAGKFSSDRTIKEYAEDIWKLK